MRSNICLNYEGKIHKLIWFNEDKSGVYVGWYGTVSGSHFSYHADGTKHFIITLISSTINEHIGTPIDAIDPFEQISFQAIPMYSKMMGIIGTEYKKEDSKSSQTFILMP
jgi:hypothetical protein